MVKKVFIGLLVFSCILNASFAAPVIDRASFNDISNEQICDAPAPDSFRVVGRGVDYVSLDWKSVSGAAGYYLEIYTRTDSEEWEYFGFVDNIASTSTMIEGISFDEECKFLLSTKCTSGLVSIHSTSLLEKIIVDLILGGITPSNPIPLPECSDISLLEYDWIGFKVDRRNGGGSESNMFELRVTLPQEPENLRHLEVRRLYNSSVYAVDDLGAYPPPTIEGGNPVLIRKIVPNMPNDNIGAVRINLDYSIPKINICRASNPFWSEEYNFTVLGKRRIGFGNGGGVGKPRIKSTTEVYFNNPVGESLNLTLNPELFNDGGLELSIISLEGKILSTRKLDKANESYTVLLENLVNGLYILQITTGSNRFTYKLMKFNH